MLYTILIIACVIVIPVAMSICISVIGKRRRREFTLGRHPVSDRDFVSGLGVSSSLFPHCTNLRRAFGGLCFINPEFILPEDELKVLYGMMFDGFDEYDLWFSLGQYYGKDDFDKGSVVKIRKVVRSLEHTDGPKIFGELCVQLAEIIRGVQTNPPHQDGGAI